LGGVKIVMYSADDSEGIAKNKFEIDQVMRLK
jgi:hypothetical protein